MSWVQKPEAWGGAIELNILSANFGVEIGAVDVETQHVYLFNGMRPRR